MTLVIQHWAGSHDLSNISGRETLTRVIDPANNVNKYRRFIALEAPGERYMLITQTGRWTEFTEHGQWGGGTYRFQKLATAAQSNRCATLKAFLLEEQARKLGGYGIHTSGDQMSQSNIRLALEKAGLLGGVSTSVPTSPTAPPALAPKPADTDLEGRIDYLVAQAGDTGVDPFDLYAELTLIGASLKLRADAVAKEAAVVANLDQQITAARKLIMAREAG